MSNILQDPGLVAFFTVTIDAIDLGPWVKMSGMGMDIKTDPRPDSAMTFFQHNLPAHMVYSNITLERPVNHFTDAVIAWINTYHMLPIPTTGSITCMDQVGTVVMMWQLTGVAPVSWKGPSLDAGALSAAHETLTIAHMGFM